MITFYTLLTSLFCICADHAHAAAQKKKCAILCAARNVQIQHKVYHCCNKGGSKLHVLKIS
jgi:hypothetical protein